MDITGALLIAFIKSYGGGTIRDLILNTPPIWLNNLFYIYLSIGTAAATFILCYFKQNLHNSSRIYNLLIITDALGLGAFCIFGMESALNHGYGYTIAIIMGLWTPIGGGILADILANRLPLVFSSELYITISLAGAVLYILLSLFCPQALAAFIAAIFMVSFRILSVKYHWKPPIIKT